MNWRESGIVVLALLTLVVFSWFAVVVLVRKGRQMLRDFYELFRRFRELFR